MTKIWYSAQESAALHEMSKAGFIKMAMRKGYETRQRSGRGGGLEYHVTSFSQSIQLKLVQYSDLPPLPPPTQAYIPTSVVQATRVEGDAKAAVLEGRARARMDAKLEILRHFERFANAHPIKSRRKPHGKLQKEAFCAAWNRGEIDSPARLLLPILSSDKLARWQQQLHCAGLARLGGRYGNRKGSGLIDLQPQLAAALRSFVYEYPHGQAGIAYQWLCSRYEVLPARLAGDGPIRLPSRRTVARWMERWKRENAEIYTLLQNPDQWKNKYMIGWGDAAAAIVRLNQLWEFDSTPADVMLKDGRHSLLGVIDVYSRRARLHVAKTSRATAVAHLLRGALTDWGIPEIAKTDNGQEYVSHHLTRIFHALEIEHHLSAPFSPWQKPFIERFFRTFSHHLLEFLPGYIGHSVAEREAIRARQQFSDRLFVKDCVVELALTAAQLQDFCDHWLAGYHARPHSGLGEQCPQERAQRWSDPVRRIADPRLLDLLLAEAPGGAGYRTVTKGYGLRIDSFEYSAVELALCVGQRVRVLYDPEDDMGRVVVFDARGEFLCIAECPEVTGLSRAQLAVQCRAVQKANAYLRRKQQKAEAKALSPRATFDLLLAQRDILALPGPNATPAEIHETHAIHAALDALAQRSVLGAGSGFTPEQARTMGYLDDIQAAKALPAPAPEPAAAPVTKVYENEFEAMRDLFARTRDCLFGPGDAAFIARFYADHPAPRTFEHQMTERVGFEAYHAWKTAALDAASPPATKVQTA